MLYRMCGFDSRIEQTEMAPLPQASNFGQTMKKPVGFLLFLISCAIGLLSQQPPHLTDQQKLKIRSAQVDFFQAKTNLEQTPQYQQFQMAQAKVNEVVQEMVKESGVDQKQFRLQENLEFTSIAPPPTPKAAEAPVKK